MTIKPPLSIENLVRAGKEFATIESSHKEPSVYGIDNGKAIGTYIEQKFRTMLSLRYSFVEGNSANGVDFPELGVDVKATSIKQPQSSCPFRDARQKVFGLGYSVLIFVYDKTDDPAEKCSTLNMLHVVLVDKEHTADYQMSRGLRDILELDGNREDLIAYMTDKNLPADEITLNQIADELLAQGLQQGYLTISNALQWRLQYGRAIELAGNAEGVTRIA